MKRMTRNFSSHAGVLLLLAACAPSAPTVAPGGAMVMTTTIQIINTGATDSIGYRVLLGADGSASFVSGDGSGHATLPAGLFDRLQQDITAAKPLADLPTQTCMKPVSFGTSTFVAQGGDRSPDLTCPANRAAQSLKDDVAAVTAFLKLRNVPRGTGQELPPQNF
jgi:hypothetical protein